MNTDLAALIVFVAFILLLGIVGKMDSKGEAQELETYCKNVKSGNWPDYKKIYQNSCKANLK